MALATLATLAASRTHEVLVATNHSVSEAYALTAGFTRAFAVASAIAFAGAVSALFVPDHPGVTAGASSPALDPAAAVPAPAGAQAAPMISPDLLGSESARSSQSVEPEGAVEELISEPDT